VAILHGQVAPSLRYLLGEGVGEGTAAVASRERQVMASKELARKLGV
jgi:hypothetical protein